MSNVFIGYIIAEMSIFEICKERVPAVGLKVRLLSSHFSYCHSLLFTIRRPSMSYTIPQVNVFIVYHSSPPFSRNDLPAPKKVCRALIDCIS